MRALATLTVLAAALVVTPGTSPADVSVNVNVGPPPPIVLAAPPPLVVVPGVPVVSYAPATSFDLFYFDHRWYYPHGGHWFVGPTYRGPWTYVAVGKLPRSIVAVPVRYYKVPPGHLKKVTGVPPGHGKGHP